ncbi:hypothetical protein [Nonomuraea dietziae]|uniref:hypothetical protein n=1 Tax=Nonomuraea dietziae TaxID=65515 RepID=UPI0033C2BC08
MTGPEHYREAEQLLHRAGCDTAENASIEEPSETNAMLLAAAQVQATLALAAATALLPFCDPDSGREDFDLDAWRKAAGTPLPQHDGSCACDHHGDHAGCWPSCECAP